MAATSMNSALRYFRALFAGRQAEGQSDQYLLERFVGHADESAFAALLQRHGPMIMGVCMRILHDEHLAEDALQATFLVLALKAGAVRKTASVASWLYGVALRLARKLRAKTSARRVSEASAALARRASEGSGAMAQTSADGPTQASRREEKELVDEELARLPDKYRLPLLLCCFEGRTQEEAAAQLGWTVGKVKGLLNRGRERLRFRLIRRGVTLSAAGLATLLGETAWAATVSPRLIVPTLKAAINLVSGKTLAECGVSASVVTLVKGGLTMSSKKILLILVLASMTTAAGFAAVAWPGKASDPFGVGGGAQKQGEAVEGESFTQQKDGKENGEKADPEDAVVDRLIEILKDKSALEEQRALALVALGKRGAKAKRASPEINKYVEDYLDKAEKRVEGKKADVAPLSELKNILQAAASVGANSKETLEILARAGQGKREDGKELVSIKNAVQMAAIEGLRQFGTSSEKAFKDKAKAELQVLAETDVNPQVRAAAQEAVDELNGKSGKKKAD